MRLLVPSRRSLQDLRGLGRNGGLRQEHLPPGTRSDRNARARSDYQKNDRSGERSRTKTFLVLGLEPRDLVPRLPR